MRVALTISLAGLAAGQSYTTAVTCSGTQKVTEACATTDCAYTPPCTPVDGEWSSWGEWGECECAALVQERMRSVSVESSCGGTPVSGSMHQSRGCDPDPTKCEVHDYKECKFSPWNPWSECKCGVLQIYRTRVLQQWSQDCGTPCDGPLKETEPCDQMQFADCVEPKDCTYAEWEPWSACSLTCGGGQKTAVRTIESEALHSGAGCNEPLTKTERWYPHDYAGAPAMTCVEFLHKNPRRPDPGIAVDASELAVFVGHAARAAGLVPVACTCDWHPWKYAPASARDVQMVSSVDIVQDVMDTFRRAAY